MPDVLLQLGESHALPVQRRNDEQRPLVADPIQDAADHPAAMVLHTTGNHRRIVVVEVLGAIGLILPPLTGVAPGLAIAAAIGLGVIQILATALHVSRGEGKGTWLNGILIVLTALAAFLATAF